MGITGVKWSRHPSKRYLKTREWLHKKLKKNS